MEPPNGLEIRRRRRRRNRARQRRCRVRARPGPFPGEDGDRIEDFPTATGTPYGAEDDSGGDSGGGGGAADTLTDGSGDTDGGTSTSAGTTASGPTGPAFLFQIDDIEDCGETCRDVTVTLYNNRDAERTDVAVYTRIYAGNSTAEDDIVWEGKREVGSMEASGSFTATERVELSISEGLAVQNEDGWITILTTVDSEEVRVTFQRQRDVT